MHRPVIDVNVSVNGKDAFGKRVTPQHLLETLDSYGITHAVCYNELALHNAALGNTDMIEIVKASNGRLGLSFVLDPMIGADNLPGEGTLLERLRKWKPESIRICPDAFATVFSPFYWEEILDAAEALSLPLIVDQQYGNDFFAHLPDIAARYPHIKFILVQYGACRGRHVLPLLQKCGNVYFTAERMVDHHQIEELVDRAGSDKLLFGTAYPKVPMAGALGLAFYADIPEAARDKLLYQNWEGIRV